MASRRTNECHSVADSMIKGVNFEYWRGLTISGIVVDPQGRLLPKAEVKGFNNSGAPYPVNLSSPATMADLS
jgi:hypothetical protein